MQKLAFKLIAFLAVSIYLGLGLYFIYRGIFVDGTKGALDTMFGQMSGYAQIIFGIVLVLYGIFRLFRAIKHFSRHENI